MQGKGMGRGRGGKVKEEAARYDNIAGRVDHTG